MRCVLKWPVAVDDQANYIGSGPVVLVDVDPGQGIRPDRLAVWTIEVESANSSRAVQVYGTAQNVPDGVAHVGSVVTGPFVWHVFEVAP